MECIHNQWAQTTIANIILKKEIQSLLISAKDYEKANYPAIQRGSYMVSGAALERENIKKDPWFATSLGNL